MRDVGRRKHCLQSSRKEVYLRNVKSGPSELRKGESGHGVGRDIVDSFLTPRSTTSGSSRKSTASKICGDVHNERYLALFSLIHACVSQTRYNILASTRACRLEMSTVGQERARRAEQDEPSKRIKSTNRDEETHTDCRESENNDNNR